MTKFHSVLSFIALTAVLSLVSLVTTPCLASPAGAKLERANEDNLTETFAEARKAQVKSVAYDLWFTLNKGAEGFSGKAILDVELTRTDRPLSIDLLWKEISAIRVNRKEVKNYVTRKGSFDIPAKMLAKNSKIEVEYTADYNKEGKGFQRSIDPEDNAEYVFSDFEPFFAHDLFPCFDQPDLKATFRVTVDAPADWKVISNTLPEETNTTSDRIHTRFKPTKPISTYLFFLGAGPFTEWSDKQGDTPMYIWARRTLAKYMDADKIFDTSRKGLRFYNDYFGYAYPFDKFGLIFIPEFAWGGMENPGAIAMNEHNIFRGPVPKAKIEGRDNLILHEMAHMWFGDLVTMKWWNDLWLNESFATYMASLAQDRALDQEVAWIDFAGGKTWGYWQDQLVTTHPIETAVPDVRTGKGNFDGITYAKGAASLKQLNFFAGEDGFKNGVRSYFKKFAFKNTKRTDFTNEIGTAAKRDLKDWTKAWLQTAGPNRVQTQWTCADGKVKTFKIEQKPSVSKTLSPHRTRIGLFRSGENGALEMAKAHDVTYAKNSTDVKELVGADCPDFVFPNVDDQDYALFALDPVSLKLAKPALTGAIQQPLLRLMIWNTLQQMVRDTQLSIMDYFNHVVAGLEKESDDSIIGLLLGRHSTIRDYYFHYLGKGEREVIAPGLEKTLWTRVAQEPAGSSLQMNFFDFYVSTAQTTDALARLRNFLAGTAVPSGIQIDQDRRWEIVSTLARNGVEGVNALIDAEEKRDITISGKRSAYAARAAIPLPEVKKSFWMEIQKPEKIPFSNLRMASRNFNNPNNVELSENYVKPFFSNVEKMDWSANDNLVEIYFENLFPHNVCTKQLLSESRTNFKKAKNLTPLAKRAWLEANDELSKCVAVRGKAH
jgi:aminopeptidase N